MKCSGREIVLQDITSKSGITAEGKVQFIIRGMNSNRSLGLPVLFGNASTTVCVILSDEIERHKILYFSDIKLPRRRILPQWHCNCHCLRRGK